MDDIEPFRKTKLSSAIVLVLLSSLIALAVYIGSRDSFKPTPRVYTVNDPNDANTTWKTERPLTYKEALAHGHCPISLPPEAKNIEFVDFYAGYGGFSRYVRFMAPVEICRSTARQVITEYNTHQKDKSRRLPVQAKPWSGVGFPDLARTAKNQGHGDAQAPWFDCEKIRNGEVWGDNMSHRPIVLIDLDRGVFYYHISD